MLSNADLRALAALAEATKRIQESPPILAPGVRNANWEEWKRAISPDVVRELIERVIKAEAIVRDVAATEPCYWSITKSTWVCSACNTESAAMTGLNQHAESCPYRRAVESQP